MKLIEYLKNKGITQASFALSLNLTKGAVARYISGSRKPKPEIANRIVAETKNKVKLEDLYG